MQRDPSNPRCEAPTCPAEGVRYLPLRPRRKLGAAAADEPGPWPPQAEPEPRRPLGVPGWDPAPRSAARAWAGVRARGAVRVRVGVSVHVCGRRGGCVRAGGSAGAGGAGRARLGVTLRASAEPDWRGRERDPRPPRWPRPSHLPANQRSHPAKPSRPIRRRHLPTLALLVEDKLLLARRCGRVQEGATRGLASPWW